MGCEANPCKEELSMVKEKVCVRMCVYALMLSHTPGLLSEQQPAGPTLDKFFIRG